MDIFSFIFHIDQYIASSITLFGSWTYVILFAIIFAETGLVIFPFLPGDSFIFTIGVFAGGGLLHIWTVYFTLLAAAILGDTVNYWIGHYVGSRVFLKENSKFFNKAYLEETREFYEKHGGKTLILARFLPIVRTFAPFVAGLGKMHYQSFFLYNVVGAFAWITSLMFAGYFLGVIPFVNENFEYVISGIILISLLPMIVEYIKYKRGPKMTKKQMEHATYKDITETLKKEHLND